MSPRRILFLAEGQLGDLLLLTPAIRAMKTTYPSAHITVLIVDRHAPGPDQSDFRDLTASTTSRERSVLGTNPNVDELLFLNRNSLRTLHGLRRLSAEAAVVGFLRRKKFDTVICTFKEDRFALWAFAARATVRVGQRKQGLHWLLTHTPSIEKTDGGVLEYYCDLVRAAGAKVDSARTEYSIPESSQRWADEYLRLLGIEANERIIGVHPGATGDYKIWPPGRYAELIGRLNATPNVRVMVFKGRMDEPIVKTIRKSLEGFVFQVEPRSHIGDLAALIRRCTLCISNDSGPRHLAVAVGTPSLALFRQFHDREWGIYGKSESIVTLKGKGTCPVCPQGTCHDKVPDGKQYGAHCLRMISVEQVVDRVEQMLAGGST